MPANDSCRRQELLVSSLLGVVVMRVSTHACRRMFRMLAVALFSVGIRDIAVTAYDEYRWESLCLPTSSDAPQITHRNCDFQWLRFPVRSTARSAAFGRDASTVHRILVAGARPAMQQLPPLRNRPMNRMWSPACQAVVGQPAGTATARAGTPPIRCTTNFRDPDRGAPGMHPCPYRI